MKIFRHCLLYLENILVMLLEKIKRKIRLKKKISKHAEEHHDFVATIHSCTKMFFCGALFHTAKRILERLGIQTL